MVKNKCPVMSSFEVLGKKWILQIVRDLSLNSSKRFKDLLKDLKGISPKTLSERLKELEKEKIISRASFNEIPPRVEYSLTSKGKKLIVAMAPLAEWAKKFSLK